MLGVFLTLLFPVLFWDQPVLSLWHLLLLPLCLVCVTPPPPYFVSLISICVNLNSFNCPLLSVAVYCLPTVWFLLCVFCWIYGLFYQLPVGLVGLVACQNKGLFLSFESAFVSTFTHKQFSSECLASVDALRCK